MASNAASSLPVGDPVEVTLTADSVLVTDEL
jgi:hypothetical protein